MGRVVGRAAASTAEMVLPVAVEVHPQGPPEDDGLPRVQGDAGRQVDLTVQGPNPVRERQEDAGETGAVHLPCFPLDSKAYRPGEVVTSKPPLPEKHVLWA